MAKMNKKDWQKTAKKLNIEFQANDTIASLQERIAFKLGLKAKKNQSLEKLIIVELEKTKPADKTSAPTEVKTAKGMKKVTVDQILINNANRDSVLVLVGKKEVWLRKTDVKFNGKEVTLPTWLADMKGL